MGVLFYRVWYWSRLIGHNAFGEAGSSIPDGRESMVKRTALLGGGLGGC